MHVLELAEQQNVPFDTWKEVLDIAKHCHAWQLKQAKPRRFLFSIRNLIAVEFNNILQIDILLLSDANVLHIIDVATGFQKEEFVDGMDTCTVSRKVRKRSVDVYEEGLEYVHIDAGTNYNSVLFREEAAAMDTLICRAHTERN